MNTKKELLTAEEFASPLVSPHEIAFLIRSTRHPKHRILLELVYSLGLSLEDTVNIKLNEIDFISGIIQVGANYYKLPKHLNNLIKFYLKNNQHQTFLFETSHGSLREEAAEKIIQTLSFRYLGKPLSALDMQSFSFPSPPFSHIQDTSFQPALPLLVS